MRRLLAKGLYSYACRRIEQIGKIYKNPSEIQVFSLKSIIRKQEDTQWGKAYGYKEIKTVKEFQRRVPVNRYLDIKPWIDKCLAGETDVLWPGRIRHFAITSGTTAKNKYIPVTAEAIATNRKAAFDCLSIYLKRTKDLFLLDGSVLFLGGSTNLEKSQAGIYIGDLSGIMAKFVPFYLNSVYEPDRKTASISNWELKLEKIVQRCKRKDVRVISGIPSWVNVLFNRLLESSPDVESVRKIWPNLRLFIHGGVDFRPYNTLFRKLMGNGTYFLETYPSSEGFIGIQDNPDDPSLLLMLDYDIFYEFIPAEQVFWGPKDRLTLEDAEVGKNYALVLTNSSGLASYIIGDTVKLVSKNPPRILVTGRVESFLNAFGEHVIVEELEEAVSQACKKTGAEIIDYTVVPFFSQNRNEASRHRWLIEFNKLPDSVDNFSRILDEVLSKKNDDYKAHRSDKLGIGQPEVVILEKTAFYQWLKAKKKLGGQNKVPRITNDQSKANHLLTISRRLASVN